MKGIAAPKPPPPPPPPPPTARAGHYAETTSQGKPNSFDVSADGKTVSHLVFGYDLNCTEVQGFTVTDTLDDTVDVFQVNSDLTFGGSSADATAKVSISVNGQLSTSAGSSGTLSIAVELYNLAPDLPVLHCSTGGTPTTWTAQ